MSTPWDIYIDERKLGRDSALGFLAVPNTASFMHKLWRCRHVSGVLGPSFRPHEVHWNTPRMDLLPVAEQWIYRVFQHRGARFYRAPWPKGKTKELLVVEFLSKFCKWKRLKPPYNIVAFLDFETDHAAARIQNGIMLTANISRCYHLDSRNNDCLQCCDLFLGATSLLAANENTIKSEYDGLRSKKLAGERLKDSEIKRYLAGFLACHLDGDPKCVYHLR